MTCLSFIRFSFLFTYVGSLGHPAKEEQWEVVKVLVDLGSDTNFVCDKPTSSYFGHHKQCTASALHYAVSNENFEMVKFLISKYNL